MYNPGGNPAVQLRDAPGRRSEQRADRDPRAEARVVWGRPAGQRTRDLIMETAASPGRFRSGRRGAAERDIPGIRDNIRSRFSARFRWMLQAEKRKTGPLFSERETKEKIQTAWLVQGKQDSFRLRYEPVLLRNLSGKDHIPCSLFRQFHCSNLICLLCCL